MKVFRIMLTGENKTKLVGPKYLTTLDALSSPIMLVDKSARVFPVDDNGAFLKVKTAEDLVKYRFAGPAAYRLIRIKTDYKEYFNEE